MLRQIQKRKQKLILKKHPLEVAKNNYMVPTNSSFNAAAQGPEERVQLNKPKHYTNSYSQKLIKRKRKTLSKASRRRLTDLE